MDHNSVADFKMKQKHLVFWGSIRAYSCLTGCQLASQLHQLLIPHIEGNTVYNQHSYISSDVPPPLKPINFVL